MTQPERPHQATYDEFIRIALARQAAEISKTKLFATERAGIVDIAFPCAAATGDRITAPRAAAPNALEHCGYLKQPEELARQPGLCGVSRAIACANTPTPHTEHALWHHAFSQCQNTIAYEPVLCDERWLFWRPSLLNSSLFWAQLPASRQQLSDSCRGITCLPNVSLDH